MKYLNIYIPILVFTLLESCNGRYTKNDTILRAEILLDAKPDSAQRLLLSIPHPEKLSKADYAAWCLQYTFSQHKLHQNIKSDSLIRISVDYYKDSNLPKQSGTAYYLLGCVRKLNKNYKDAMWAYKQAEDILKKMNENNLKGFVAFSIGEAYMEEEELYKSLNYLRKSQQYFILSQNLSEQASVYREISYLYALLDRPLDSIMYYSNLALKLSKQSGDSTNYHLTLQYIGEILRNSDYRRSKECLLKAYSFLPTQQSRCAAYLAYEYSMLNKPDSAKFYLNIASADTSNFFIKTLTFINAAKIYKQQGNMYQAFKCYEKAYKNRNLSFQQSIRNQAYQIDKQYDSIKKEKENAQLRISNQRKMLLISLLIIIILVLLFIISHAVNLHKEKLRDIKTLNQIKQQSMEFDLKLKQTKNKQKQDILLLKLQNRINNTLLYNQIKNNYNLENKKEEFIEKMIEQYVLSEKGWQYYIDEVDQIFDKKISIFRSNYPDLSQLDLIVITLICLRIDITDICSLLEMNKSTLYKRRFRIKERIGLEREIDLEQWVKQYLKSNITNEIN